MKEDLTDEQLEQELKNKKEIEYELERRKYAKKSNDDLLNELTGWKINVFPGYFWTYPERENAYREIRRRLNLNN